MQAFVAFLLLILNFIVCFGLQLWMAIVGWGLTPQSWPVILGGAAASAVVTILLTGISTFVREA